jgi:multiple sugar transport system ATP-binding protein
MNFLNGKLDGSKFITSAFSLDLPHSKVENVSKNATDINNIVLGIRPEDIEDQEFALNATEANTVSVKVMVRENYGSDIFLSVKAESMEFNARVNTGTKARVDQTMNLVFDMNRIHIFDGETEKNLTI